MWKQKVEYAMLDVGWHTPQYTVVANRSARCESRNPTWWAVWSRCCDRERTATDRYPVLLSRTGGARSGHSTSIIARLLGSHRGMTNAGRHFPHTSYIQKMAVQTLAGSGPRFADRNIRGLARPIGSAPPPQRSLSSGRQARRRGISRHYGSISASRLALSTDQFA
jgi:hypothetical protein